MEQVDSRFDWNIHLMVLFLICLFLGVKWKSNMAITTGQILSVRPYRKDSGIMCILLILNMVYFGFNHSVRSNQRLKTGICCLSYKRTTLRIKNEDRLPQIDDNMFE